MPDTPIAPAQTRSVTHRRNLKPRRWVVAVCGATALATSLAVGFTGDDAAVASNVQSSAPWVSSGGPVRGPVEDPVGQDAQQTSSDASADQSTGLVEITSTLVGGEAAGTGMVLTADGTVVTNHHVVAGATAIEATVVSTGQTYTATYVGGDATADVAVLTLQGAGGLTPVDLSDDAAQVGDVVTAVGDAGGDGGSLTASPGTVQALEESITVSDETGADSSDLSGLIEIAANVVPGDSGGAVLSETGQVVGMNVAASSGSRDVTGYAIAIDDVEQIAAQITSGSTSPQISRGYSGVLGVSLAGGTPLVAEVVGDSAAERAGIGAGDTITAVDDQPVNTAEQLVELIGGRSAGDQVAVSWMDADGVAHAETVTLGQGGIA